MAGEKASEAMPAHQQMQALLTVDIASLQHALISSKVSQCLPLA
jgi:hypothetical protein